MLRRLGRLPEWMAIPAQSLGIVTLLILMTSEASLPFGYFPLVGEMTGDAFRG